MAQENTARVITIAATEQPQDIRLRVAAYARVSSSSDEQLNSFAAQNRYYTELISGKDNWQLVDIYADEGITGTSIEKRDDFKRMLRDCERGLIDRILVKSISRFARNTTECLETVRSLKARGISVYFEKEGIDTGKVSGEMLTAVFASLAQAESESISKNMRWSYQKRMQMGTFIPTHLPYGYCRFDCKIAIVDAEAEIVKRIFNEYLMGKNMEQIAASLNTDGIPFNNRGTLQSWSKYTVGHILENEKYIGDSLWQKTYYTSTLPRYQKKNLGEMPQYYAQNTHPAIIDSETYAAAQKLRSSKTDNRQLMCSEKAVFVTKNTVLVSATKKFLEEQEVDVGFPLAITDEDLCVIAWLKDFKISNNLPKMRLLENVLAAINPTPELMDAYFSHINSLEKRGSISQDEATLLRIEHFARTELMSITHGNPAAVDEIVVDEIRCRMKEQSYQEGLDKGKKEAGEEAKKFIQIKRNKACKRAETEIDDEYAKKEIKGIRTIKIVAVVIALCFVCASIYSFINSVDGKISYALLLITLVTTVQGAWPFFGKDNWATNLFKRNLNKKKRVALDERKKKYLSLLE